jgi:hypothetical protein
MISTSATRGSAGPHVVQTRSERKLANRRSAMLPGLNDPEAISPWGRLRHENWMQDRLGLEVLRWRGAQEPGRRGPRGMPEWLAG